MVKNPVSGSVLAKMFPTLYKHFSENASQEEFNKAEQEAAVVFQQHNGNSTSEETPALGADVSALLPTSAKLLEGKLTAEELKGFAADMAEVSKRLTAQATGNQAVKDDLTKAQTELTTAQGELTKANDSIKVLQPKADSWDAHQKALKGATVIEDSTNTNGKGKAAATGLSEKEQANLDDKQRLAAQYPGLMAELGIPAKTQE